ncbi:MAG: 4Fe-4S binding protein [Halobacteriota archaeon]|nr:4Fe-4S binding protein [Halobacteriota archaeon]
MNAMEGEDPYERIIEKMREYPNDIPMVDGEISEAFREYIKLLFTPEEEEIAQHLEVRPLSVGTISKRLGRDRRKTKAILEDMVEKGTIQNIGGYSLFLSAAHLFNIGFKYSKALERLGKKGAELYQQFFIDEKYYRRYESSDAGTSLMRVIPIDRSIDYRSEISNAEEVHRIIDGCIKPIVITDCPCRNRTEILGIRECKDKYPIKESCFQLGAFGSYFLKLGEGKELSIEEAHKLVDEFAKLGVIFTTENIKQANHQVVCCCCDCCCSLIRGMTRFKDKNENCVGRSNYISEVDQDLCKGCELCEKRCVFEAITIENEKASVKAEKCYGCGVCAVTCPTGAIKVHRHERTRILENAFELVDTIYRENRSGG